VFLSRDRRPLRPLAGEVLLQYAAPVSVSRFTASKSTVNQPILAAWIGGRTDNDQNSSQGCHDRIG
jgi:hypothetical protein